MTFRTGVMRDRIAALSALAIASARVRSSESGLRVKTLRSPRTARAKPPEDPDRLVDAVGWACGVSPFRISCLTRALALNALLRRRGAFSRVVIGVRTTSSGLDAHAWVELDGVVYGVPSGEAGRYSCLLRVPEAAS